MLENFLQKARNFADVLEANANLLLAPPDHRVQETAKGASLGIQTAVAVYRLTQDPALVAMAILPAMIAAYHGAQKDNERARQEQLQQHNQHNQHNQGHWNGHGIR